MLLENFISDCGNKLGSLVNKELSAISRQNLFDVHRLSKYKICHTESYVEIFEVSKLEKQCEPFLCNYSEKHCAVEVTGRIRIKVD